MIPGKLGPAALPQVVLDTNVVLDWLVFGNPGMNVWSQAIDERRVAWLASPEMRGELVHVLGRSTLGRFDVDAEHVLTSFDRLHRWMPQPCGLPATRPRCSDPSDQKFIDLALAHGAAALITRDRSLLKLARRTVGLGLRIGPPETCHPSALTGAP